MFLSKIFLTVYARGAKDATIPRFRLIGSTMHINYYFKVELIYILTVKLSINFFKLR